MQEGSVGQRHGGRGLLVLLVVIGFLVAGLVGGLAGASLVREGKLPQRHRRLPQVQRRRRHGSSRWLRPRRQARLGRCTNVTAKQLWT